MSNCISCIKRNPSQKDRARGSVGKLKLGSRIQDNASEVLKNIRDELYNCNAASNERFCVILINKTTDSISISEKHKPKNPSLDFIISAIITKVEYNHEATKAMSESIITESLIPTKHPSQTL
jgi:hypothetical protein